MYSMCQRSIILGHIERFNACKIQRFGSHVNFENGTTESSIKTRLKGIFSALQLDMIEAAFEKAVIVNGNALGAYNQPTLKAIKCIEFGKQYPKQDERLVAILKNIIKHGSFKP